MILFIESIAYFISSIVLEWLSENLTVPFGKVPKVLWAEGAQCNPLLVIIPYFLLNLWAIIPLSLCMKSTDNTPVLSLEFLLPISLILSILIIPSKNLSKRWISFSLILLIP